MVVGVRILLLMIPLKPDLYQTFLCESLSTFMHQKAVSNIAEDVRHPEELMGILVWEYRGHSRGAQKGAEAPLVTPHEPIANYEGWRNRHVPL